MGRNDENQVSALEVILAGYLKQFKPAAEGDTNITLKTTARIERDIADMVEPGEGEVAEVMARLGYQVWYMPDNKHGWAMVTK